MVMTREEARGITVRQLLYYMGEQEIIQVCFKDDEWDEFVEMPSTSKLLIPFIDCRIDCIGAEKMEYEDGVAIRISIDESGVIQSE